MNKSLDSILNAVVEWIDDKDLLSHFQNKVIERCELVEKRRKQHKAKIKKLLGGKTVSRQGKWDSLRV